MTIQDELPAAKPQRPCWGCGAIIDAGDNYCRVCGKGQDACVPWYYKHWGVIASMLLGLGPFTLFPLWRSPVISRRAKFAYTALIVFFTYLLIKLVNGVLTYYQNLLGGLQGY